MVASIRSLALKYVLLGLLRWNSSAILAAQADRSALSATSESGTSCFSEPDCESCYALSLTCHWCGSKNECHAKGSAEGCLTGSACDAPPTFDPAVTPAPSAPVTPSPTSEPSVTPGPSASVTPGPSASVTPFPTPFDDSCYGHDNCDECYAASSTCHWCSDEHCHAKGSIHGCLYGETCPAAPSLSPSPTASPEESSCIGHRDCEECYAASSTCHWCSHDQACHVKGSVYGCLEGQTCGDPSPGEDTSCFAQKSCDDCYATGKSCHWCGAKNECHVMGSIYGCVTGVNCAGNHTCVREVPQPVHKFFTPLGVGAACIIVTVGLLLILCNTGCLMCADGVRGAFNDLVDSQKILAAAAENTVYYDPDMLEMDDRGGDDGGYGKGNESVYPMSLLTTNQRNVRNLALDPTPPSTMFPRSDGSFVDDKYRIIPTEDGTEEEPVGPPQNAIEDDDDDADGDVGPLRDLTSPLLLRSSSPAEELSALGVEGAESQYGDRALRLQTRSRVTFAGRGSPGPTNADKAYRAVRSCYLLSTAMILLLITVTVALFPRIPQYNFCSDQIAWESIVESMASMSIKTSFQMLGSVYNPNHMKIHVTMGTGTFLHAGVEVGTLVIPDTTAQAAAITDVWITATFKPSAWEALSLSTDYYTGKLVFTANAVASVEIPFLNGYSFKYKLEDFVININRYKDSDRHLCACP